MYITEEHVSISYSMQDRNHKDTNRLMRKFRFSINKMNGNFLLIKLNILNCTFT